jgi:hypothetical protein
VRHLVEPRLAWFRLARMQRMLAEQPTLARAVSWMSLYDQLDLTLELLHLAGNTYLDEETAQHWPSNVIRFRVRRPR